MSEWRPIETAPKDGTEIDVWCDYGRETNAYWGTSEQNNREEWCVDNNDGWAWGIPLVTHWMPIPEPPK